MQICAVYARYSSEDQKPTSIDDQLRRCKETAAAHGLSIDERRIYSDAAMSGSTSKRKSYLLLKQAVDDRLFNVLIVDEMSRLGRNMLESISFTLKLAESGIRLIACDGLDTNEKNWRLPLIVKSFAAEQEVEQLIWRVKRGIDGALDRGFQVSPPPFGYRALRRSGTKGSEWEIIESEAAIVREIYAMRLRGQSCNAIAHDLEMRGVSTRGAEHKRGCKMWRPAAVFQLVRNAIYRGVLERGTSHHSISAARKKGVPINPVLYERPQYRLVDDETWYRANQQSDVTGASRRKAWGSSRHLLGGLIRCGDCGLRLSTGGDARSKSLFCPTCQLTHKQGVRSSWIGYTSEGAGRCALEWGLTELMTPAMVLEFQELLRKSVDDGPAQKRQECERALEHAKTQAVRLRRLLMFSDLADDVPIVEALSQAKQEERELTARLKRLQAESALCDGKELARQLAVDPRDLLGPLFDAPPDAAHLNAVLRRLVPVFRLVGHDRRYHAVFELTFDLAGATAAHVGGTALTESLVTYRVVAVSTAKRPIVWTAQGERIEVQAPEKR